MTREARIAALLLRLAAIRAAGSVDLFLARTLRELGVSDADERAERLARDVQETLRNENRSL